MKIHDKNSAALVAAAAPLRVAVAACEREIEAVARDEKACFELAETMDKIRGDAGDDLNAANRLAGLQIQHESKSAKCAPDAVRARLTPHVAAVQASLPNVAAPLVQFLTPRYELLLAEIGDALKPFVAAAPQRRSLAAQTDSARALIQRISNPWSPFELHERPFETARKVLADVDSLLAGAEPWRLTP